MPLLQLVANRYIPFEDFEVFDKAIGYRITDVLTGEKWDLTVSQEAVDHVDVEAVHGKPDLRWIRNTGDGTVQSVEPDEDDPNIVVGGTPENPTVGFAPFTGYTVQYISTEGDNNNDGTENRPKLTGLAAYQALAPGGTIFTGPNTLWSNGTEGAGFVSGQGCRIKRAGYMPAGFVEQKSIIVEGWGCGEGTQFGNQVVTVNWGTADYTPQARRDPGIWLVATSVPITFRNIKITKNCPVMWAIDYVRNDDLTVCDLPVTNATRADGYTTLTVTSRSYEILQMSRADGIVTIRLLPVAPVPYRDLCQIVINPGSASGSFGAGTFTMNANPVGVGSFIDITYPEAGADVLVPVTPTGASVSGSGSLAGDEIEFISSNAEFVSTMYEITTAGPTSIVVRDRYGGWGGRSASASAADVGTWVLQERFHGTSMVRMEGCNFFTLFGGDQKFNQGPTVNLGDTSAGSWNWMDECSLSGAMPETGGDWDRVDPARAANLFGRGYGGVGIQVNDVICVSGNFYIPKLGGTGGGSFCVFRNVNQNGAYAELDIRPCIEFVSGFSNGVIVDACWNADQIAEGAGLDKGTVYGPVFVSGTMTKGSGTSDYAQGTVIQGAPAKDYATWETESDSYDLRRVGGVYGSDLRVAGKRDDIVVQGGVYQGFPARNVLPEDMADAGLWVPSSGAITVTGGQADPDGGTNAFLVSGTGTLTVSAAGVANPVGPAAVGDVYAMAYRIRIIDGTRMTGQLNYLDNFGVGRWWEFYSPFGSDGAWEWVIARSVNTWAGAGANWRFIMNGLGKDFLVYQPSILWLPAADYSPNRQAAIAIKHRFRPEYLPDGAVGTMPGAKLIGHGGIGGPSSAVTLEALPNGNSVPYYGRDGVLLGYLPLYNEA